MEFVCVKSTVIIEFRQSLFSFFLVFFIKNVSFNFIYLHRNFFGSILGESTRSRVDCLLLRLNTSTFLNGWGESDPLYLSRCKHL